MSLDPVLRQDHGPVSVLTLNAPERLNPLSDQLREALAQQLDRAMQEAAVRVIVLTGAGGNFSAGADIRQMPSGPGQDPDRIRQRIGWLHQAARTIIGGPRPVIAAVEGAAFGAGLALAAACDLVVAGATARFGAAFGRIGLMPDTGLLWSLPRRIGLQRSRDLVLRSRSLRAAEAEAIGLVDVTTEPGMALERALAVAQDYLLAAPQTIAVTKAALAGPGLTLEDAFDLELREQPRLLASSDHLEARTAFLEKRAPVFTDR